MYIEFIIEFAAVSDIKEKYKHHKQTTVIPSIH